eukprot:1077613_1
MSLVNTSNTDSIKTNFFKLFTALSSNSKISFSFSSILTWKISTQTKDQTYPNLAHCRSQFYSQTLYVYNGISALSYLSVHNVLLIKEPSLNPTQHNQLMLWIFVTNPFIYQFYKSAGYRNQSKYMRQLLEGTKYVLCAFNFRLMYGEKETITVLSDKIQRPRYLRDHSSHWTSCCIRRGQWSSCCFRSA